MRWILGLVVACFGLVGCGSGGGGEESEAPKTGAAAGEKPAKLAGKLEVAAFKGGYGIDFYEATAKEFGQKHPELKIEVWGNPRVWEQLKPRFVGDDPPDLVFPGWGFDHWAAADEGQLLDLGPALDGPAAEGGGKWRDSFDPSILKLGQLDGKQYAIPFYVMLLGWWYDPGVFEKNGWTPPKTWDELLSLCEKIKAKGIAPITFQGKYPYYMIDGMLLPWCLSAGGKEALDAAQNLEPGAWKSPAMLKAAQMIDELNKKGYLQRGAVAMTHTEAQQEFLQGRAAMVPCGSWLPSEMKEQMPPGAKMKFMLPPSAPDAKGDPTAILIGIEPWMVPTKAKNPDAAIEFFKYMTSPTVARKFVEQKATPTAIRGSETAQLPEVMVEPVEAFKNSKTIWAVQYRQWYPAFNTEIENALTSMLNGQLTPEAFCDRVEAAAEKTRQDDTLKKYKVAS